MKLPQRLSRRNFLLSAGAGGAAAAAAIAAKNPAPAPSSSKGDKRTTRGYQPGERVENYYRTTKI